MFVSADHKPPTTVSFLIFFILLSLIFLSALLHDFRPLNLLNIVQQCSEQLLQFFGGDSDASSPKDDAETGKELKPVNDVDKY
jgi:hypothetical protein